ncbi:MULTISPECIES: hypothetical protein [unclassified Pseudomonas]|uniref:hypothetical protein n=1 Tax=unclassified Pseudomonas TaxID=196821 RepID=UPI0035BF6F87
MNEFIYAPVNTKRRKGKGVFRQQTPAPIVAPEVLADANDNTVKVTYLRAGGPALIVTVEDPWILPTEPGDEDYFEIYHLQTDTTVLQETFVPGDEARFPFSITIPQEMIEVWGEGQNTFIYKVEHYNGSYSDSAPLVLLFDRFAPYDQLPPVKMPDITDITSANIDDVELTIPNYSDFMPGDRVFWWWGTDLPSDPTIVPPTGNAPVLASGTTIPVARSVIEATGNGGVVALYVLMDKAGNNSSPSVYTQVGVALGDLPDNLQDPVVPRAAKGRIIQEDAAAGVVVQVPEFDHWIASDELCVSWGAHVFDWSAIGEARPFPLEFTIPSEVLKAQYGSATGDLATPVAYEVRRGTVKQGRREIEVDVNLETIGPVDPDWPDPVNSLLELARVVGEAGEENFLTEDDEGLDATIHLEVNTALQEDDLIQFYWDEELMSNADHTVLPGEPGTTIEKTVLWEVINRRGNAIVPVRYTVTRPGNPNTISSRDTAVRVEAVNIYPEAPEFLKTTANGWLNCNSIYEDDNDTDPAVRVQVQDLSQYGLKVGDTVVMHWRALYARNGDDAVPDTDWDESIELDGTNLGGFVWRIPYVEYVQPIYDKDNGRPDGRGRAHFDFTLAGRVYTSMVKEAVVSMHNGVVTCPLRPTP